MPESSSRRQRPVSCRFCRGRKLRCSRTAPCSNCVSRGLHCELVDSIARRPSHTTSSESELLERIRKLEEIVRYQRSPAKDIPLTSDSVLDCKSGKAARNAPNKAQSESLNHDVAWLESIYSDQNLSENLPCDKIVFRICTVYDIAHQRPFLCEGEGTSSFDKLDPPRCIWLPLYHEAKILLDKFSRDIDHLHHVIHTPSLQRTLDEVYGCVTRHEPMKSGRVILVLSIFASCARCWMSSDRERGLCLSMADTDTLTTMWVRSIDAVLDIAHRTTHVSIEGVQGLIITCVMLKSFDGGGRRCLVILNLALMLARELGLHRIDHASNTKHSDSAQAEIGRRVWWYLASSDWSIAARLSFVSQGMYQCHTRQMAVKKPLNIDDEDIVDGMDRKEKSMSQPTLMTYSLLRLRLCEISRNIVDRLPLVMAQADDHNHAIVMDIDTEMQLLINDIPAFFTMSVPEIVETYSLDPQRATKIVHQGFILRSLIYGQQCKLHFPYFARGYSDSHYGASREICIQTARLIVQNETGFQECALPVTAPYKFLAPLLAIFIASITLIIDTCHQKTSSQQDKKHISDALRILESAKHESKTTARFLESLTHILRKHKVPPLRCSAHSSSNVARGSDLSETSSTSMRDYDRKLPAQADGFGGLMTPESLTLMEGNDAALNKAVNMISPGGDDLSEYFNDLAQSFALGFDVENLDWGNIFTDLNSSLA